jgi:hypothetical protein
MIQYSDILIFLFQKCLYELWQSVKSKLRNFSLPTSLPSPQLSDIFEQAIIEYINDLLYIFVSVSEMSGRVVAERQVQQEQIPSQ